MAEVELQLESEQILQELAMQPSSINKAPTNRYQQFVNTYVLTNQTMKWVDAVKCAQGQGFGKRRPVYCSTKESSRTLKTQQDEADQFIFKVKLIL